LLTAFKESITRSVMATIIRTFVSGIMFVSSGHVCFFRTCLFLLDMFVSSGHVGFFWRGVYPYAPEEMTLACPLPISPWQVDSAPIRAEKRQESFKSRRDSP